MPLALTLRNSAILSPGCGCIYTLRVIFTVKSCYLRTQHCPVGLWSEEAATSCEAQNYFLYKKILCVYTSGVSRLCRLAQAVGRQPLTAETRCWSGITWCGMWGGHSEIRRVLRFLSVIFILSMLHTHPYLNTTIITRTRVWRLRIFKQSIVRAAFYRAVLARSDFTVSNKLSLSRRQLTPDLNEQPICNHVERIKSISHLRHDLQLHARSTQG